MNHKKWGNIQALKKYLSDGISRRGKTIILAIAASLFIGSIFGVISLQMAEEDGAMQAETDQPIDISNQQEMGETSANMDSLSFYVVQAGVFEKEANAKEWLNLFHAANYPGIQWKNDNDIYLFVGIGETKETAEDIATEMKDADLDVFVKEWEVQTKDLDVTEADEQYIQSFLTAWQQSLAEQDVQALKDFAVADEQASEALQPLIDELEALRDAKEIDEQKILLDTIYLYENFLENTSK